MPRWPNRGPDLGDDGHAVAAMVADAKARGLPHCQRKPWPTMMDASRQAVDGAFDDVVVSLVLHYLRDWTATPG